MEKERVAAVWVSEKFERYLLGLENFKLETDQKLLVTLMNTKNLHDAPLWCQRMLMRLMWFHPTACIFCMEEAT